MVSAALLCPTAIADASYEGTPGKVAYLDPMDPMKVPLKLWDPVTEGTETVEPKTWNPFNRGTVTHTWTCPPDPTQGTETHEIGAEDAASAPSWSPDGSQFAFAKRIPDSGDYDDLEVSAIFVYTVKTGQTRQVTNPDPALTDHTHCDTKETGHLVTDFSPAWSGDGNTIAFVRHVQDVGLDDDMFGKRGQNLWRVPAAGGSESQVTHYVPDDPGTKGIVNSAVWIPGTQDLVVSYLPLGQTFAPSLGRVSSSGGFPTALTSANASSVITDYDVSPDGTKLGYVLNDFTNFVPYVQPLSGPGAGVGVSPGPSDSPILRFAGTKDGLLLHGCTKRTPDVCGLVNRLLDDPDASIDRTPGDHLALAFDAGVGGTGGSPIRSGFDVQPQTLPVIFVPGFLGTVISCGGKEEWPSLPFPDLLPMSLGPDGQSDAGCQPLEVLETADLKLTSSDIYKAVAVYVRATFGSRGTLFGWDWRKRPQPSFIELETAIDDALAHSGPWKAQDTNRVVLWGHSYGGLLIRQFIKTSGGDRVGRVLTVGTPSWGAPKTFLALAFGVESPVASAMDAVMNNERLKGLAKNLSGLYNLLPSNAFPSWLSVDGVLQGQAGVSSFIGQIGGNSALFNQAASDHQNLFDGFYDHGGRIDVQAVVGTGLNTVRSINVQYGDDGTFEDVIGSFDNGDSTVPGRSGAQGPVGGGNTSHMGDPIHVQYTCNISHVPLPGDGKVLSAYGDFLKFGTVPRKLPPACESAGGGYHFTPGSIGRTDPQPARASRVEGGPLDFDTAEQQGLADVMDLGPATLVVVNDVRPVSLNVKITNGTFTYTPLAGATEGAKATYGPLTGTLTLAPTDPGAQPLVLLDGMPVGPSTAPAATPTPSPTVTPGPTPSAGSLALGRRSLKGRKLSVVANVPGPGALTAQATGKVHGRKRTLGRLGKAIRAAGAIKLALKLKGKPAKVRLVVAFTPTGGKKQTRTATVKRSR